MFSAVQLKADHARLRRFLLGGNKGDSPEHRHALGRVLVWGYPPIEHLGDTDAERQAWLDWVVIAYCEKAHELIRKSLKRRGGKKPRHGTVATQAYLVVRPHANRLTVRTHASTELRKALTPERLARLNLWNPMPEWEAYLDTGKTARNWLEI